LLYPFDGVTHVSPFQNILVPTDFEPTADGAVELATAFALTAGARITFAHVLTAGPAASVQSRMAEADALLRAKVAAAAERGINAEGLLLFGDAIRAILSTVDAREVDLVVMGTHGGDAHAGIMLGSVVEEVVRRAKVPVLTASSHVRPGRWLGRAARPLGVHTRRTSELPPGHLATVSFPPAND
jgi:nucleotide-binding universal stress UspA family protein